MAWLKLSSYHHLTINISYDFLVVNDKVYRRSIDRDNNQNMYWTLVELGDDAQHVFPINHVFETFQPCKPLVRISVCQWFLQLHNNKKTLPEAQRTQKLTLGLALVANLTTRWRHLHQLQIWPTDGATCISCKFGHQMAPLALVANLATRWHHLHELQSLPPDGTTCKFSHLMVPLVLVKIWSSGGATCIVCKVGHQVA